MIHIHSHVHTYQPLRPATEWHAAAQGSKQIQSRKARGQPRAPPNRFESMRGLGNVRISRIVRPQ